MAIFATATGSVIGTVLLADLVSGAVHWAEDAYIRKDTPVLGKLIADANIEHHEKPRAFIMRNWWTSSWDLLLLGIILIGGTWATGHLTWQVCLFAFLSANANQVHKWAHQAPHENGHIVTFLQKIKILQTQRHHAQHHRGEKNSHYCSITNVLNPVLDELGFWQNVELLLYKTLGLARREDTTVQKSRRGG
jgi:plasmanylethanolamine desaturase